MLLPKAHVIISECNQGLQFHISNASATRPLIVAAACWSHALVPAVRPGADNLHAWRGCPMQVHAYNNF